MKKKMACTTMIDGHPVTGNDLFDKVSTDDRLVSDLPSNKQSELLAWLGQNFHKGELFCHEISSYGLKHKAEDAIQYYVSNNQLKDAMLMLGFETEDEEALNWYFDIDSASPFFQQDEEMDFVSMRGYCNMTAAEFANNFNIPISTYHKWEQDVRKPPYYVYSMMEKILEYQKILKDSGIPDPFEKYDNSCEDEYGHYSGINAWEIMNDNHGNDGHETLAVDFRFYDMNNKYTPEKRAVRLYPKTIDRVIVQPGLLTAMLGGLFIKYDTLPSEIDIRRLIRDLIMISKTKGTYVVEIAIGEGNIPVDAPVRPYLVIAGYDIYGRPVVIGKVEDAERLDAICIYLYHDGTRVLSADL